MGGRGSGRPPSPETIVNRTQAPNRPIGEGFVLPNLSGVKDEARKEDTKILATQNDLNNYVSYSGATGNVDLNAKELTNISYFNAGQSYTPSGAFSPISVTFWTDATLSKTLMYNEFNAANSATQERSFVGFRNVMVRNTNDNQTALFTGGSVIGAQNQLTLGGTLTNNPTIIDRQTLSAMSNTITDQMKWNKTGKSTSVNVYGVQNIFTINGASELAGTTTRNYYGLRNFWSIPGSTSKIANAYGIYLNNINAGANTVTGNLYGVYQEGSTNINVFEGSTSIGKTTAPTEALDVDGVIKGTGYKTGTETGQTTTQTVVTDIRMNDGQLQKKTRTNTYTNGLLTTEGSESDWTDTTDV